MEPTTAPAPQSAETSTEAPTSTETTSKSDPNESFSDWLKRQPKEEGSAPTPKEGRDEKGRFLPKDKAPVSESDTNVPQETTPESTKSPEPVEPELKIGDKAFKAKDIESLQKSYADMQKTHETTIAQVKDLIETLKSNPGAVLDHLGINQDAIANYYYNKYVQPEVFKTLPPEEKVKHYEKLEQDRIAAERTKAEEAARVEQEAKLKAAEEENRKIWAQRFETALTEAGIPNTQWAHNQMASYMKQAQEKNIQVEAKDLIPLVKEDLIAAQKATLEGLKPEELAKLLGDETMAKLRAQDVAKFKQEQFENKTPLKAKVERSEKPKKRISSIYELLD